MKEEIRKELIDLGASPDAIYRLSRLMYKTESGVDKVYLSPIGESVDPLLILEGWDKIFDSNKSKMNSVLLDLEDSNRSKYGPRSIAAPWSERREGVSYSYGPDETKTPETKPPFIGRLRPLSIANSAEYIKRDTNAGLPSMQKKGNVLSDTLNNIEKLLKLDIPAVTFTRTQENNKTRLVWGYPLAYVLDEMRYYKPLLEYQRNLPWRAALRNANDIDVAITTLIINARKLGKKLLSIDFSKYDDSLKRNLQSYYFDIYLPSLFQKQYHPELKQQGVRFNTIRLITPDGILTGSHGTPSGSVHTNEEDSVGQKGVSDDYKEEKLEDFQIQGDDGAYSTYFPEKLMDHFRSFGLIVNDSKSYISDDYIIYLQNLFHHDYLDSGIIRGIYPTYRALLRIVYQESFNDFSKDNISGKDYYAIRTLSILENVKHHPLFEEFVTYVTSLDKYNLNVSDQGISSYIKLREKQDGKDVKFTEYRRGDGFGIKSFESYKLAKELNIKSFGEHT